MARARRMEVLSALHGGGLVPLFYHPDVEVACGTAAAVAEGGCRVLEFTNRGDRAIRAFEALAERCDREGTGLFLGVGSVIDAPTAALYLAAGASFIVAPNFDPEVARLANRRGVAYIPGCGSVSEVLRALEAGVEIVKIFPANSLGGSEFFSAIRGPCPWVSLMPTGGVDLVEENVRGWIRAGAACVGMGSKLLSKDVLSRGDWAEVTRRVRLVLGWIAAARNG